MKGAELERCQALLAEGYGFWTSLGREPLSQAQRERQQKFKESERS